MTEPDLRVIVGGGEAAERRKLASDVALTRQLGESRRGEIESSYANIVLIVRHLWGARLAYNVMSELPELDGRYAHEESEVGRVRCEIYEHLRLNAEHSETKRAILHVAAERRYHPVKRYLEGLEWDGTERWGALASSSFGVEPTPLVVAMLQRWGVAAVARAFQPGCQVDQVLVLQGEQGLRKSTFFEVMGGEWFGSDDVSTGIEGVRQLSRKWIWCWDELAGMGKRERASLDGFVTRRTDMLRPMFREWIDHPRTTVIAATANPEDLFDNPEGLRRWHVVPVRRKMAAGEIAAIRDQLWAEAAARYLTGEHWYLDGDEELAHAAHMANFRVVGAWDQRLAEWVRSPACILLSTFGGRRGWVTTHDALEALDVPLKDRSLRHTSEVGASLRRVGCDPVRSASGQAARPELYGVKVSAYRLPAG